MSVSHSGPAGSSYVDEEQGRLDLSEDCATAHQVQDELKPEMIEEGI